MMKFPYSLLLCALFFFSCISDEFTVGDNLVSVNGRSMVIENVTVELSTHLGDSSVTTGLSRIFEGRYHSSDYGTITAHSYFDFNPPGYSLSEFGSGAISTVRFDSISLILQYDDYSYGDTTKTQTINIYKLLQNIEPDESAQLYNTSSVQAESEPWITHRFNRPSQYWENDSILELRLPDEFGLELMELMQSQSELLDSYDNFKSWFRGIKLSPSTEDEGAVNSFVANDNYPLMRFYYSVPGASTIEEKHIDMTINSSSAFSQVETDRSNTLLATLSQNSPLSSAETENRVYLQGLAGIYAKVSFPDLNEILKLGDYVILSSAILYVYPVLGTYNAFSPLPANLALNYLDESGKAIDIYADPSTTTVQSGSLVEDYIYNKNTYYAFDITSYLQYELGLIGVYKSALQLSLEDTDNSNSLKSLVFGDSSYSNTDNRVRLIIHLIVYDRY